jgi:hypothetical protein
MIATSADRPYSASSGIVAGPPPWNVAGSSKPARNDGKAGTVRNALPSLHLPGSFLEKPELPLHQSRFVTLAPIGDAQFPLGNAPFVMCNAQFRPALPPFSHSKRKIERYFCQTARYFSG